MLDVEALLGNLDIIVTRSDGIEFFAKCPMHPRRTGKEDRHPSWSMNGRTFAHHCFSCGYSGNIATLYQDLTGATPDDLDWELAKQSVRATLEPKEEALPAGPTISEWSLSQYAKVPTHLMERRHLQRESLDTFGIRWDPAVHCWVIPIRDPDGVLMGYQYRQKGNVINYPEGMEKSKTLFGIHLAAAEVRITIVESPLDAVRFHGIGIPAVSSFGAAISRRQFTLLSRHFRTVIVAMDNDSAGRRSSYDLAQDLRRHGQSAKVFDYSGLAVKDPGDVQSDEDLRKAWESSNSLGILIE